MRKICNFVNSFKIKFKTKKYFSVKHHRLLFIVFLLTTVSFRPDYTKTTPLKKISRVVIDPGHGGHDPGAVGKKSKEKDIVLDVSLMTGNMIKTFCPDVEVFYTRDKDVFVELFRRAKIANDKNADLFISIHCNAAKRTEARGTEVFVMGLDKSDQNLEIAKKENASILLEEDYEAKYEGIDPNSTEAYIGFSLFQHAFLEQSLRFAAKAMGSFNSHVSLTDRGVKQAPFLVLWRTTMPSVLIEIGFISNPVEEEFMMKEENKKKIAYAIYKAFVQYKSDVEGVNHQIADFQKATGLKPESRDHSASDIVNPDSNTTSAKAAKMENDGIVFSVQIFVDRSLLSENSNRFKGVKNIFYYHENGYYKYVTGKETSFQTAAELQKTIREAGFSDAFVVAFQNGERIDTKTARQLTGQ
jgi:N-acetylmuramoyl-L-alanine amidase